MMSRRHLRGHRTDRLIVDEGLTRVLVGTLARSRSILGQPGLTWPFTGWAYVVSNHGPLPCEGSALPLSYTPEAVRLAGVTLHGDLRPVDARSARSKHRSR